MTEIATGAEEQAGTGGLPCTRLRHASGAEALVYLHGAHVTSFRAPSGDELLFLSERARFGPADAIRGGVPVIFPQFGPGALPKHGFARTATWDLVERGVGEDGRAMVVLALRDDPATRALWPHRFDLQLTASLGERLTIALEVQNRGDEPLSFTGALHTYLRVRDVERATLSGLHGVRYRDQLAGGAASVEHRELLRVDSEVDRVYERAPATLTLTDEVAARAVQLTTTGFPDVVVWNPWVAGARALSDLGDAEYRRMLCVEAAAAASPIAVAPHASWVGSQTIAASAAGS